MQQKIPDLDNLACQGTPTDACIDEVDKVCAESQAQDWEVCNNCIREHHPDFQSQCTNTSETGILYKYCLGAQ
jgi:hypothetical protein